jgi:ABC-type multidrug transport system fused ATPase/permease subunit
MHFLPAQIVVLDAGRVVEQGNHKQLVQRGGRYAALVSAQDLTLQQTLM